MTIREDGMLEVVTRFPSPYILFSEPPRKPADRVIKQVYGVGPDLQIKLVEEVEGRWIPPHNQ